MPLTGSSWAVPRSGSPAARPASWSNSSTSSPVEADEGSVGVASSACPVLDSYRANALERTNGPYVSQYASSSLTQCGRLMAPVSQRLTFGWEAVVTPNSMRRTWAHPPMSCPACSRAARSRSRSASPQTTSGSGCPDTTIVSHTRLQELYASRSYYTYVTYIAVADRAVSELPRRQSRDRRRYPGTRAPPRSTYVLVASQGRMPTSLL